LKLGNWEKKEH